MVSYIRLSNDLAPLAPPAGKVSLFTDTADKHVKQIDENGLIIDLTNPASSMLPVVETISIVHQDGDPTAEVAFDLSALSTGFIRSLFVPDRNVNLDLPGSPRVGNVNVPVVSSLNITTAHPVLIPPAFQGLEFINGETNEAVINFRSPSDVDSSANVIVDTYFITSTRDSGGTDAKIDLEIVIVESSGDDVTSTTISSSSTINPSNSINSTVGYQVIIPAVSIPSSDFMCYMRITRDSTDGSDDFDDNISIASSASISYTKA